MKLTFADSSYWIALLKPDDDFHRPARAISPSLKGNTIVTSELVLAEVLDYFCNKGPALRDAGCRSVFSILDDPHIEVIELSKGMFDAAYKLYCQRRDKLWSFTDCVCMTIMADRKISEVLTTDHHFEQAGFIRLL